MHVTVRALTQVRCDDNKLTLAWLAVVDEV
jgi:hypothetical protein